MTEVNININTEEEVLDEGDYGLPDGPHVEIAFDALKDTLANVEGTESLTQAQTYMEGILMANGAMSRADLVNGSEGFFSAVGSGAKKTWDYIVQMFKNIWGFFFKKDAPAAAKEAKAAAVEAKATLGTGDVAKAKASLSRAVGSLKAGSSDSKELDELSEAIGKANNKADVDAIAAKVGKKNDKARKVLTHKVGNLIETFKSFGALIDQVEKLAKEHDQKDLSAYASTLVADKGDVAKTIGFCNDIRDLQDLPKARSFLDHIISQIDDLEKEITKIAGQEASVKASIDKIEKGLGESEADKATGEKELTGLRHLMASAAKHAQIMKRVMDELKSINKSIPAVFGL